MAAAGAGSGAAQIERRQPRRDRAPVRLRQASGWRSCVADGVLYFKGAVEALLPLCTAGDDGRDEAAAAEMAARGLRVLAVARGPTARRTLTAARAGRHRRSAAHRGDRGGGDRAAGGHPHRDDHGRPSRHGAGHRARAGDPGRRRRTPPSVSTPAPPPRTSCGSCAPGRRGATIVAMTGDGVNDAPALTRGPHRHRDGKGGDGGRRARRPTWSWPTTTSPASWRRSARGAASSRTSARRCSTCWPATPASSR